MARTTATSGGTRDQIPNINDPLFSLYFYVNYYMRKRTRQSKLLLNETEIKGKCKKLAELVSLFENEVKNCFRM